MDGTVEVEFELSQLNSLSNPHGKAPTLWMVLVSSAHLWEVEEMARHTYS